MISANASMAEQIAALPQKQRDLILGDLSEDEALALEYDWQFWGRRNQLTPPGSWSTWLALAGRGFGKTETGAQFVRESVDAGSRSIALLAETQKDLEEVMVPRILKVHPPHLAPTVRYKPVRLVWPNGATALGYNGTEPDQLRGPEFDTAWCDELAKYLYAQEVWDMLQFTMRRGPHPRVFISTTPRPIPIIRQLIADSKAKDGSTIVTRGSTFDNAANLPPIFLSQLRKKYAGTRLGRQELNAELLDDVPGALWTRAMLDRANQRVILPQFSNVVVAVDPSGTKGSTDGGDEIGIIAAARGMDGRAYVLEDATVKLGPAGWGRQTVRMFHEHLANAVVAEVNFGGAMVEHVIKTEDSTVPFIPVTAARGKSVRAEPVAALYEQGRVTHVGNFSALEDQMVLMATNGYMGEASPDRLDALVWALTHLMLIEDNTLELLMRIGAQEKAGGRI